MIIDTNSYQRRIVDHHHVLQAIVLQCVYTRDIVLTADLSHGRELPQQTQEIPIVVPLSKRTNHESVDVIRRHLLQICDA